MSLFDMEGVNVVMEFCRESDRWFCIISMMACVDIDNRLPDWRWYVCAALSDWLTGVVPTPFIETLFMSIGGAAGLIAFIPRPVANGRLVTNPFLIGTGNMVEPGGGGIEYKFGGNPPNDDSEDNDELEP